MAHFRSCEETLVVGGALAAAVIHYELFNWPILISASIGVYWGAVIAYFTRHELSLYGDSISYRTR